MNEQQHSRWEYQVRAAAQTLRYPTTPDLARTVRSRLDAAGERRRPASRLAWAVALFVLALAGLMAAPQVRAAVVDIVRIGVVQIFLGPATLDRPLDPTSTHGAAGLGLPPTATPRPSPTPISSLLDLAGETTLAEAQGSSGLEIRLPAYPPGLGAPDRVFLQDQGGPVVVLVWLEPSQPDRVRLSLHLLAAGTWGLGKQNPTVVQFTEVNAYEAVWTEGPYLMYVSGQAGPSTVRLIEGHVLIWTDGAITFRLETDLPLEEAVRIAESLQ